MHLTDRVGEHFGICEVEKESCTLKNTYRCDCDVEKESRTLKNTNQCDYEEKRIDGSDKSSVSALPYIYGSEGSLQTLTRFYLSHSYPVRRLEWC